jgi:4-amino-4-deoxy-L-arabinose transferase-like glycosyltransferase
MSKPDIRMLMWIVFFAFAVKVGVRWYIGAEDFWTNGYTFFFELAKSIAAGHGIALDGGPPTAFRVPLYPAFLAAVTFGHEIFLSVVLAQALIGAGTVWCAALLAREMFGGAAAITAAVLTAMYPYYVVHDTALQETSLFTFLTALAVLLLLHARRSGSGVQAMCAGLTLGAGVLVRANLAPFAMIAPLWLALPGCRAAPWQRGIRAAFLCAGVAVLTVSPWLIRSFWLTGSPVLTTQSGFFLWLGNNPYTFAHYPHESIDRSQTVAVKALTLQEMAGIKALETNEAAVDQWFRQKGLEYIREHPWQTFNNGFRKIGAAFGWLPSPRRSFWPNLVHLASYGPVMILGLWGMWAGRRHWREHMIFYWLFFSFAAVTAVFFGHTSYRAYLDVYWIVFAAGALAQLFDRCALGIDLASGHPNSSDKAPGSRRRNENGKVEWLGSRLGRRNGSSAVGTQGESAARPPSSFWLHVQAGLDPLELGWDHSLDPWPSKDSSSEFSSA